MLKWYWSHFRYAYNCELYAPWQKAYWINLATTKEFEPLKRLKSFDCYIRRQYCIHNGFNYFNCVCVDHATAWMVVLQYLVFMVRFKARNNS